MFDLDPKFFLLLFSFALHLNPLQGGGEWELRHSGCTVGLTHRGNTSDTPSIPHGERHERHCSAGLVPNRLGWVLDRSSKKPGSIQCPSRVKDSFLVSLETDCGGYTLVSSCSHRAPAHFGLLLNAMLLPLDVMLSPLNWHMN